MDVPLEEKNKSIKHQSLQLSDITEREDDTKIFLYFSCSFMGGGLSRGCGSSSAAKGLDILFISGI